MRAVVKSARDQRRQSQYQRRPAMLASVFLACPGLGLRHGASGPRLRERRRLLAVRCSGRPRLAVSTLQPLQSSHFRSVLVAQIAVLLQRLVDDPLPVRAARRDSAAPQEAGARSRIASKMTAVALALGTATARSPSHRAPRRTKTDRCAHPVPCPRPARATCRRLCPASLRGWSDVLRRRRPASFGDAIWLDELATEA